MAGFKDFVAGAVLGESDLDDYLMSQTVMRFASAAARDAAVSGILTEGLVAYLADVDQWTGYNGSAWVILGMGNAQLSHTPFISQGANPTMTTTYSTYWRQGRQIVGRFRVVVASGTGTAANTVTVTLPSAPADTNPDTIYGNAFIYDNSAAIKYRGFLCGAGLGFATARIMTLHSTTDGVLGSTDFTAALAVNDVISCTYQYEAASASA